MHYQFRDLGREIIHCEKFKDFVKFGRLWMHEDALEVLREEEKSWRREILMFKFINL